MRDDLIKKNQSISQYNAMYFKVLYIVFIKKLFYISKERQCNFAMYMETVE